MPHSQTAVRVGGVWLATASILIIAALALHGPIDPVLSDQMTRIADRPMVWSVAHWIAAAALSLYAVAGLIVLTSGSRLTEGGWTLTAWAVLIVGALWTLTTAVAEATAVTGAAVAGSEDQFAAWWAFAEGKATGFAFLALGVAVIAGNEARSSEGATPTWSAWAASAAGLVSFAGWALSMWFGVAIGNPIWLAASILFSAWTVWFGIVLWHSPVHEVTPSDSGPYAG